jgi:hypothetical protein
MVELYLHSLICLPDVQFNYAQGQLYIILVVSFSPLVSDLGLIQPLMEKTPDVHSSVSRNHRAFFQAPLHLHPSIFLQSLENTDMWNMGQCNLIEAYQISEELPPFSGSKNKPHKQQVYCTRH